MSGKHNFISGTLIFSLLLSVNILFGQSNTTQHIAITNLKPLPTVIIDTQSYSWEMYVVNLDPVYPLQKKVSVYMSINGNPATPLVLDFMPSSPVLPGDSLLVFVNNYTFSEDQFKVTAGKGPVHDIIVWPLYIGNPQVDSAEGGVYFVDTDLPAASALGANSEDFPNPIYQGQAEDLSIRIQNDDSDNVFYEPFEILMSIDGDTPQPLASNLLPEIPLYPGDYYTLSLSSYLFDATRFSGGGGITHDIIVWPLRTSGIPTSTDSLVLNDVVFVDGAAFEVEAENLNGLPTVLDIDDTYNLQINAMNVGIGPNLNQIEFLVKLDSLPPVILNTQNSQVFPGGVISSNPIALHLASLYGISSTDSSFQQGNHNLHIWAREENGNIWNPGSDFPVISIPASSSSAKSLTGDPTQSLPGQEDGTGLVMFQQKQNEGPLVFPNPAKDVVNMDFSQLDCGEAWIHLYSLGYKSSGIYHWQSESLISATSIDINGLKPGIYLYTVTTDKGNKYYGKLVKQ